jgi:Leucine-rich repeat (LRR) protein
MFKVTNLKEFKLIAELAKKENWEDITISTSSKSKLIVVIESPGLNKTITFGDEYISFLPNIDAIRELTKILSLRKLDLKNTKLENLPPEIGNLINLESLNLSGNKIKTLPVEIRKLTKLKELDLRKNQELKIDKKNLQINP